jgi:CDP-diacylglycerol--glycerol-3-phosphate 3-phosphatidyltransferase
MNSFEVAQISAMESLKKSWVYTIIITLLAVSLGYLLITIVLGAMYAARWLVLPAATTVFILIILRQNLAENSRSDESTILPDFGWGNLMTLARGILVALMMGFLFIPKPEGFLVWIPGILYILANITDFLDGYLARITNHATKLGEILDMSFDGLGVMVAGLLAVKYGQLPIWYISIAFARYIFIGGIWLRKSFGKATYDLLPSIWRRLSAGLQMGFLAVILLPIFTPPGTHIAAYLFGVPFLVGFLLDWLDVCGVRTSTLTRKPVFISKWLPIFVRAVIPIISTAIILKQLSQIPILGLSLGIVLAFQALLSVLLLFGVAPRISAIIGLVNLGFYQTIIHLSALEISLAGAYSIIIFLGSGAYDLWLPENNLIYRRPGEKNKPIGENTK